MCDHNGLRWASLLDEATSALYTTTPAELQSASSPKLRLIAVRCKREEPYAGAKPTKKGRAKSEYVYSVLAVRRETIQTVEDLAETKLLEQLAFYDNRATIESASFSGDKQGLKLIKRRKASLYGQEMLILLAQLVHNLVVWARDWLSEAEPRLAEFGIKVWVRDLFTMPGRIKFKGGRIVKVQLRRGHQNAPRFFEAFYHFFAKSEIWLFLNRARFSGLEATTIMLRLLINTFVAPNAPVEIVLDETLERRWARKIKKRCHWRDSLASSRKQNVTTSGLRCSWRL